MNPKISEKIEVELCVKVNNENSLLEKLRKLGAVEKFTVSYTDEYFDFPGWKLREKGKRIRIRRWNEECEISYKGSRLSQTSDTKPDKSFRLSRDQADILAFILEEIGLKRILTIHQRRMEFSLGKFILELDKIKNVGTYLTASAEIKDSKLIKETEKELWNSVLYPLGFTKRDIELRGKIGLVLDEQFQRKL